MKGQENLDNLLKLEVYATMVHEFKCLYAHGYLCQAHLDFLKQWKAARRKTNLANLYVPVGRLLKVRGAKED